MHRARADQYATRVNVAAGLLAKGLDVPEAMRRLAKRFEISERQARRYVEQARDLGEVDVPPRCSVFTTRLPEELIERLKGYAKRSGDGYDDFRRFASNADIGSRIYVI